jgi:diguanylate cyclase (GGDEF)-like protein
VKCPKCLNSQLEEDISTGHLSFKCPDCGLLLASKQATAVKKQDLVMQISKESRILACSGPLHDDMFITSRKILGKKIDEVLISEISKPLNACLQPAQILDMHFFEYFVNTNRFYEIKIIVTDHEKVLAIISNISEFRQAAKTVRHLAYHDPLTGLPNRFLFNDRLQQTIARADREKKMFALLFLDLDNFKHVNDTLGHKAGDVLLKSVAERLRKAVRQTDSISHITEGYSFTVARVGGDEFILLLNNIENVEGPAQVAGRILKTLAEPFKIGSHEVFVTTSIGIAVFPVDGNHMETLLINADVAMYQAKNYGKNRYQYYSKSMNEFAHERFAVETKLRKALSQGEFMLVYQPQVDIQTGKLIGVEALIRWLQPDLVLTRPADFIPLAEKTGLIIPMGEWILRTVCTQSRLWQKAGLGELLITVNVSGIQFQQDNFTETLYKIIEETGIEPGTLQLELTETAIMNDSEKNIKKLLELQMMGIQISIDDFGTGYSSLKYLKHFPLSTLKIDQSFVRQLESSPNDQAIVRAIITLAHNFNLKVIAEGVEKRRQLEFLRECGCEGVQGYLICPPSNPDFLTDFLKKKKFL